MAEYRRLDEVCNINMGQSPTSDSYNEDGDGLPFFQGNADFGELYPNVRIWCSAPAKIVEPKTLLISVRAPIGALNFSLERSCIGRGLAGITPVSGIKLKYVYYCLKGKSAELNAKGTGSTFKAITKATLGEVPIRMIPVAEQQKVIQVLDTVSEIINQHKQQLSELDTLIKARFVKMFGDPIENSFGLSLLPMIEICSIIDGDRGVHYPKQGDFSDEDYCLFLNAKNVTSTGFNFSSCMFISKQKDNQLRNGKLMYGDIVLTTRGTIGNIAYYTKDIPFENVRINSGMVILRMKDMISEIFFIEQFKMLLPDIKEKIASGSAQPQLPISTMNKISILVPPLHLQEEFSSFVQQIDKSKFTIEQSLKKLETLKRSLMNKYFG